MQGKAVWPKCRWGSIPMPTNNHFSRVISINISQGGIPKLPVSEATVTVDGIVGDGHAHEKHIKPTRALSLLDEETIETLKKEGYAVGPGIMGENLTVRDLNLEGLSSGTRLVFAGGVTIELTDPRKPCFTLDPIDKRLQYVVIGRFGFMARVVTPGLLQTGAAITVQQPISQIQAV